MYRYRRQHKVMHKDNSDRWLVSYADYMTLMFALFVVLYAFVLLEKDEFKDVVSNLESAIQKVAKPGKKAAEEPATTDAKASPQTQSVLPDGAGLLPGGQQIKEQGQGKAAADDGMLANEPNHIKGEPLAALAAQLKQALADNQQLGGAKLRLGEQWLTLELPDSLLFSRASATLQKPAQQLLASLAPTLKSANNYIRVRGYTDSTPISDALFASNWELSAARAAAVLRQLIADGVEPPRLAIEGYGAYGDEPVMPAEDRRRVVLALSVYGWEKPKPLPSKPMPGDPKIKEVSLPGGGIRITSGDDN
ncbi:OmpA family protein [Gallaecimonas mangrovi]|uniref:OmpA family protein n=1 Tax=Gallaecimonas mangrovi TaxID=2291597 RepID=UPI000E203B81|nr:OmpA family protein [Gallaecimonas mangrovi]